MNSTLAASKACWIGHLTPTLAYDRSAIMRAAWGRARGSCKLLPEDQCFARIMCEMLRGSRMWLREMAGLLDHAEVRFMCAAAMTHEDEGAGA